MGRYKEFREPRRRGYDDDYTPSQDWVAERTQGRAKPSAPGQAPAGSEPVEAVVKWFKPEKGFGFVAVAGGPDAFLHVRTLESAGHSSVVEGTRLKVRLAQGDKGAQVTEVIEVDANSAQAANTMKQGFAPSAHSPRHPDDASQRREAGAMVQGTVKWFNATKGYGFIQPQSGGRKDVFVHISAVERAGLYTLNEGQIVEYEEVSNQGKTSAENLKVQG
jgi:CspA family cold shock protein